VGEEDKRGRGDEETKVRRDEETKRIPEDL